MKVLVLRGEETSPVTEIIRRQGDETMEWPGPLTQEFIQSNRIDFIVIHGFRHIIKPACLDALPESIVNLHISLLPWNRGADPNLWSFLEDTPKGITIHCVDAGIDSGNIIMQRELFFHSDEETLATTYSVLQREIVRSFVDCWPEIRARRSPSRPQPPGGSFHRIHDKDPYLPLLARGWETPVGMIRCKAKR